MLTESPEYHQTNLFGSDPLLQLDPKDPLLQLAAVIPCHTTEIVHFRKRIGKEGINKIFQMSITLHGKTALEMQ